MILNKERYLKKKTIIVSGNKILSIENGYLQPKSSDDKVIDLKDKTVMPELIDMHVHMEMETNHNEYLSF